MSQYNFNKYKDKAIFYILRYITVCIHKQNFDTYIKFKWFIVNILPFFKWMFLCLKLKFFVTLANLH